MTIHVSFAGETKSIRQWAMEGDIPLSTVYSRLDRGWNILEAITKPLNARINPIRKGPNPAIMHFFEGKERGTAQIALMTGWSQNTIRHWIKTNKPIRYRSQAKKAQEIKEISVEEYTINNMLESGLSHDDIRRRITNGN